ncbi:MAG: acetyl-CoA carboxylase biotin carboxyl carrier protein [Candidatus Avigastranaerophilus sp.]
MKEVSADYIEKLIDIMKNNELTEVMLEDGEKALFIKSNDFKPVIKEKEIPVEAALIEESVQEEIAQEEKKNIVPIVSNMIGMFYSKPSPEEKPFVQVGDTVKEGQVVCIVETIKLVNKVTSDVAGKVVEICIEDGKPVEYGQTIMYIEKTE